jgi:hypothetical protein
MAHLSVLGIINLIRAEHHGASDAQIANGTAIALAESGGDLAAISPSGDYGLWQINRRYHFGDGIIDAGNWQDPVVQFQEMWKLSGGMQNWGAWCTAYSPENVSHCGAWYLPNPEPGSPAQDQFNVVDPVLSGIRGTPPPGQAPPGIPPNQQLTPGEAADFAYIKNYLGSGYAAQLLKLNQLADQISSVF